MLGVTFTKFLSSLHPKLDLALHPKGYLYCAIISLITSCTWLCKWDNFRLRWYKIWKRLLIKSEVACLIKALKTHPCGSNEWGGRAKQDWKLIGEEEFGERWTRVEGTMGERLRPILRVCLEDPAAQIRNWKRIKLILSSEKCRLNPTRITDVENHKPRTVIAMETKKGCDNDNSQHRNDSLTSRNICITKCCCKIKRQAITEEWWLDMHPHKCQSLDHSQYGNALR